jgi:integrase
MTSPGDNQTIARLLLSRLGLTLDDLRPTSSPLPTIAQYLPTVIAAARPGARTTYTPYWQRIAAVFGDRRLDEVTASDIATLMQRACDERVVRRNSRDGTSTREHMLRAVRAIYHQAEADDLITHRANPAARVPKPQRPDSTRRALTSDEIAAINTTVASTGNDAVLDSLLIRLHLETACRRGAALALRNQDLDEQWALIGLREKNHAVRWQPASPTLIRALADHRDQRGTGNPPEAQLLRYRDGTPITTRRYDHLWTRVGKHLPWVTAQNISTHWLRHTTVTWVERHFGYGIARAYAGHTHTAGPSTTTYIRADLTEVAAALSALTGEPHPLAGTPTHPGDLLPPFRA